LLAPPESVLAAADFSAKTFAERQASITSTLVQRFGLPRPIASAYGYSLLLSIGRGSTNWYHGAVQGAVATWLSLRYIHRGHPVATAPCTAPNSDVPPKSCRTSLPSNGI
jgi:hypothetical protein